jgi:hypothetical protein
MLTPAFALDDATEAARAAMVKQSLNAYMAVPQAINSAGHGPQVSLGGA